MNLKLENVGKIQAADIDIKGITVIAGLNNMGKSTILKSLYLMSEIYDRVEDRIIENKIIEISNILTNPRDGMMMKIRSSAKAKQIANILVSGEGYSQDEIGSIIKKFAPNVLIDEIEAMIKNIENILNVDLEKYLKYFSDNISGHLFKDNINCMIDNDNKEATIQVNIVQDNFTLKYIDNETSNMPDLKYWNYNTHYLKNWSMLDLINNSENYLLEQWKFYLTEKINQDNHISQYEEKQKNNKRIKEQIQQIVKGKLQDNVFSGFTFYSEELKADIPIANVAEGMKNILVIQKLLDNGWLDENSVLLLDEPETNLHPEWQIVLAKIIVLIQKVIGCKIVINSHSPYFIRAIEVSSADEEILDCVKFYQIKAKNIRSVVEDVTHNTELIYKTLYTPLEDL